MESFSEFSVWGFINLISVLLLAMLFANMLKKTIKFLRESLIPTSVLGGILLLLFAIIYEAIKKENLFNTQFFGGNGSESLEILTYHCLALGFIASALKPNKQKFTKERSVEIFNSGITTVSSYLMQAVLGLGITILVASFIMKEFFPASGVLLMFGFGQGTGQALNYGIMYEGAGFIGGRSFGLTIAALGFLSASFGGVIYLNILKRKGKISSINSDVSEKISLSDIQSAEEISINGSIDKLTIQLAFIFLTYGLTYLFILGLSALVPGLSTTLFGFNFLFGVIMAALVKLVLNFLHKKKVIKKKYINDFLMNRISGFFFDMMVIAGIAAIRISALKNYWVVIIVLALVGAFSTFFYNRLVAKTLFKGYQDEQFLVMFGMLTGTASTGVILLRELDKDFTSPASDNLVYQQIPAIAFGFPLMLLANIAPERPIFVLLVCFGAFIAMNIILFRSFIFKKRKPKEENNQQET